MDREKSIVQGLPCASEYRVDYGGFVIATELATLTANYSIDESTVFVLSVSDHKHFEGDQ